jgi:4-amino-4-deoxy-L-arabinose transferase-like glycosyltransferase
VGRLPGAIAALLLAFSPFFVGVIPDGLTSDDTGNSLLTDSPALTLLIVAFWLLLRALDGQSAALFAWTGLTLALSILMRFGTLPVVGMLFLVPLTAKRPWKALMWCGVGLLFGLAPYLLWSRLSFGSFFFTLHAGWRHAEESEQPILFYLRNSAAILTPVALLGLVIATTSWLWPSVIAVPSRPRLSATFPSNLSPLYSQTFLWIWLLMGFVIFSAMPHKEPRYILPIAPPFLLLAGSGLALCCTSLRRPFRRVGALLVAALLVFTFFPLRERLSGPFVDRGEPVEMLASQYLQASLPRRTILYMSFNYPAFAFYTAFRIHELSAVGPALYSDIEQIPPGGSSHRLSQH